MKDEKTTLEIGDRLYKYNYGGYFGPIIIESIADNRAIAATQEFSLDAKNIKIKKGSTGPGTYHLETPRILQIVHIQELKWKLETFQYGTLTISQLERINAILSENSKL